MRRTVTVCAAAVATMVGFATLGAQRPGATSTQARTRIGVFDSRMVALAYYNSEAQRSAMKRMSTELAQAKAAGDQAKIQNLEFQGPALQSLMHYQVFSTASIPNVMEELAPALPQLAERAGVSLIVSKWEIPYHRDDVEYVDVTDDLVRAFNPNAQVQKWIAQSAKQPPVPLLQAVKTMRADQ